MAITLNGSTGISASQVLVGSTPTNAANSARDILTANPYAPSGWYWINWPYTQNNVPLLTYCDMSGSQANSNLGGWMRIDQAWWAHNLGALYNQESPTAAGNWYWAYGSVETESANNALYFNPSQVDGGIRAFRFRVPTGSRGVRVHKLRFYSINGPDGYSFEDYTDPSTPTKAQIITAGDGSGVSLGSNYTSFGIYFGDGNAVGKRLYKAYWNGTQGGSGWPTEVNGGWVTLNESSFVQWDDIGTNADRIIWYESDGGTEYDQIYEFTFWIR